ncbi:MAG: hypothetical protein ACREUF_17760 [Solimonas sp.]
MRTAVEYDEKAVAWIEALEEKLARRLPDERFGAFATVLNAIEYQVEMGQADPTVLRHLGEALLALASVHHLPVPTIKDITQTLGHLHSHAAALNHASST